MSIADWTWRRREMRIAAGALALCGLIATPVSAKAPTILRARLNADILSSDPGTRRDENTDAVLLHVVEGLVAFRKDGTVGPLLAKGWTVSGGGRTYTFALRQGVYFQNGVPLTSADVVWSFNRYLDPATHWRCRYEFQDGGIAKIVSITAPDDSTVVIVLDRPAPLFLTTLSRADCGGTGILQRASVAPDDSWRKPVGTGPFMFGTWKHNQYVELKRFARYQPLPGPRDGNTGGKHALVDTIRFLVIPDDSAALAALLRGNIDILDGLSPDQLRTARGAGDIRIVLTPTLDFYALLFQTSDPVMKDPLLRRAVALSIDTAALANAVTWGTGLADNSPIPKASPFHGPAEALLRKQNIALAKDLVRQSHYRGERIVLIANRRYPQMFDAAVLIQAMAREAGIDMQIQTLDWATQVSLYLKGAYQAMMFGFSAKLDPSLSFDLLIGDKKRDPRKVWDAPEAQSLLRNSVETADPGGRQAAFDALNAQFLKDVPAIVLFNTSRVTAIRSNVKGYEGWSAAQQRFWDVSKSCTKEMPC